jgi:hypothetical protein
LGQNVGVMFTLLRLLVVYNIKSKVITIIGIYYLLSLPAAGAASTLIITITGKAYLLTGFPKKLLSTHLADGHCSATPGWNYSTCHMHILNVLGMAYVYVGPLVEANVEGVKIAHGRTEHYVQRTMMAADLQHRHFSTAEGRMALFLIRNRRGARTTQWNQNDDAATWLKPARWTLTSMSVQS